MSEQKILPISFADTGIATITEYEERTQLKSGMNIVISKIEIRTSRKYGKYAVFDGETLEGEEIKAFTMSQVITAQSVEILKKYGDDSGTLANPILVSIISVKSAEGRYYLSFA